MRHQGMERECHVSGEELGSVTLNADPDLLALRSAAAREKEAFLEYRHHGMMIADRRLAGLFHEEARHEAGHFIALCQMLSHLDPDQAAEFQAHDLAYLASSEPGDPVMGRMEMGMKVKDPEKWLEDLKEAVDLELHTLNVYQEDASRALHVEVKELLTRIMNHEKQDLAIFVRELQRLLHEHR